MHECHRKLIWDDDVDPEDIVEVRGGKNFGACTSSSNEMLEDPVEQTCSICPPLLGAGQARSSGGLHTC